MNRIAKLLLFAGFLFASVAWADVNISCAPPVVDSLPISDLSTLLANAHGNSPQNRLASAKVLGWINTPYGNNLCGGYFAEPYIPGSAKVLPPIKSTPVTITAAQSELQFTGVSTLSGGVVITQPGRIVTSDTAHLTSQDGKYQKANLVGNVMLREAGKIVVGKTAELDLQDKAYQLDNVIYRLFLSDVHKKANQLSSALSAWGKARKIVYPPSGITELHNVSYSTCPPESRAWSLEASQIRLDQEAGRGYASNAVLYAGGLPILYAPYFNFPIDDRRQSGFLYPQFVFGSESGFGLGVPYYWNIAPNYDDTFTPYFYTKRGFLFNNLFRYLTPTSHGRLTFSILPNDWAFRTFQQDEVASLPASTPGIGDLIDANPMRNTVSFTDQSQFTPNLGASVNYTRVSDDYFLQDIGGVPQVAQNQLLQQGQVLYNGGDWNFLGNLQSFQTLHPVNEALVQNQYSMLPQLLFTSNLPFQNNHLNFSWQAEFVNFLEAANPGMSDTEPTAGQRINIIPGVSLPLSNAAGYITPAAAFEFTQYNLTNQLIGLPDEITRSVPIFDVDSGLFLSRDLTLFGDAYEQTLEPRIFYLYVPYRDQNDIPLFDTALQPFSYNQLFTTNRFSGSDRVGDANQLSLAVSTRFIDQTTGDQKAFLGVGIIKYFKDRDVSLCENASDPNCLNLPYSMGTTTPTEPVSPIAGQFQYNFNQQFNAQANVAWDPNNAQTQNASLNFQYMPAPNHIINVGYSYVRFGDLFTLPSNFDPEVANGTALNNEYNLSQPTASFAWPIDERWSILGSWSYSLNQNHSLTYFGGVEYNSCCWAVQVVMARSFDGFNTVGVPQYNTGVYVQWAFKGLAKVAANDPTALLLGNIPGYQNNFDVI